MWKGKKEFLAALFVIVIVLVTLALPYALIEAYGLTVKKLALLMPLVVLGVFSVGMLIWWWWGQAWADKSRHRNASGGN